MASSRDILNHTVEEYSLEVVTAHIPVEAIPLHAFKTPIREFLAGIEELAGTLTAQCQEQLSYGNTGDRACRMA